MTTEELILKQQEQIKLLTQIVAQLRDNVYRVTPAYERRHWEELNDNVSKLKTSVYDRKK